MDWIRLIYIYIYIQRKLIGAGDVRGMQYLFLMSRQLDASCLTWYSSVGLATMRRRYNRASEVLQHCHAGPNGTYVTLPYLLRTEWFDSLTEHVFRFSVNAHVK